MPAAARVRYSSGSGVAAMDMTVLLGNCLENAWEALRALPPAARRLSVEIVPRGVLLLIRIVNTCGNLEDSGDFAGWEAFPSCKGKERKGVGLRSVALISEKYGGSGTEEDPYRISTAEDLAALAANTQTTTAYSSAHYVLTQDIDLSGVCGPNINGAKKSWTPIGFCDWGGNAKPFAGVFDGGGHTVSNLYINEPANYYQGLFAHNSGTIKNLSVTGSVTARRCAAGICGQNKNGKIINCHNACSVSVVYQGSGLNGRQDGRYAGGICGINGWYCPGELIGCSNSGNISAQVGYVGGICGLELGTLLERCWNTGSVSLVSGASGSVGRTEGVYPDEPYNYVGGVCGVKSTSTKMPDCFSTGEVTSFKTGTALGGICGWESRVDPYISNVYFNSEKFSGNAVGNKAGSYSDAAKTSDAFSSGEVAYLLQGNSEEQVWGQTLGEDGTPVLTDDSAKRVNQYVLIDSNGTSQGGYINNGNSVTVPAGGSVTVGDTTITPTTGGNITPNADGTVTVPTASTVQTGDGPEITVGDPGGSVAQDGTVTAKGVLVGSVTIAAGESGTLTTAPNGTATAPAGSVVCPLGVDMPVTLPDGGTVSGAGIITVTEGGTVQVGKDSATTITPPAGGEVKPKEDGDVTVPGGSTIQTGNGPTITMGPENGGTVSNDGGVTVEDGGTVQVGGTTITPPSGGEVKPTDDGGVTVPGGSTVQTGDTTITIPEIGGEVKPTDDGGVTVPGGSIIQTGENGPTITIPESYTAGTPVTIQAAVPEGQRFTGWTVETGGIILTDSESATFTMPARPVTVTANFEDIPAPPAPATYLVTVNGGTGGGTYEAGAVVMVTATVPSGRYFAGWTVDTGNVTLGSWYSPRATFVMPAQDVAVTANFEHISDGGSSGGGSSSDGGGSSAANPPEDPGGKDPVDKNPGESGPAAVTPNPFSDIAAGAWYYDAVRYVQENGLMGGYEDGTFGPNDSLTRAQFAQILFNRAGKPAVNYLLSYTDVADGAWYAGAIRWAASQGIAGGYGNGMFGPNDPITREQLAVMLWRYAGSPAATDRELHFNDTDEVSGFALEALRWAVEKGVISGYGDGRLAPQGLATRAQVAQMLKSFLDDQK